MGILDMSIQIALVFCFVVTLSTGVTPYIVMNSVHMSLKLWMFSSSEVTLATDKILNFVMGILDMSIQIGLVFCLVFTVCTGVTPNITMNFIHVSLKIFMQSSSKATLATDKFLNFVMGILDMSLQIGSVLCFVVTISTGVTLNIVMNRIHMPLKTFTPGHLETTMLASEFVKVLSMLMELLLQLLDAYLNWLLGFRDISDLIRTLIFITKDWLHVTMNIIHVFLKNVPLSRVEATCLTGEIFHRIVCNCIHAHCSACSPMTVSIVLAHFNFEFIEFVTVSQLRLEFFFNFLIY